jgi:MFS family permease
MSWFGTYTFVNAYVIRGLGRSNEEWTAATLWYSGGMIFWYLICTDVSARLGRRNTVTLGLASTAAGYIMLAGSHHLYAVYAILALLGLTTVANAVAWTPLVAEGGGARPGRVLALTALVGTGVGSLCLLGGGLLISGENYPMTFLVIGVTCAVGTAVFHVITRPLEAVAFSSVVSLRKLSKQDLSALFRGPFLVVALAGVCMDPFSFHTVNQLFPNLARDRFGFGEGSIGVLVALGRIPALISLYLVSSVVDRLNIVRLYAWGLACDGLVTAAIVLVHGQPLLIGAYLGFYLVHGVVWGTVVAAINACLPGHLRDSGFAISWMLEILAVFLVGVFHNRLLGSGVSLPALFGCCGFVLAIAGMGLVLYSYSRHSQQGRHGESKGPH